MAALEPFKGKNELFDLGVAELETVVRYMSAFGVRRSTSRWISPSPRGLDYYTGTVYETVMLDHPEVGSICSGGRYDNLAEYYTDKQLPGVGISIGLTRLFSVLEAQGYLNDALVTAPADVLILPMTEELSPAISFATALRDAGVRAQLHCEKKKFKQKLSYADKLSIPYAAFLGEDEIQQNKVTVKDLTTGQQQTVTAGEAVALVQAGWRPGRAVLPSKSRRPDGTFSPCPRLNGENPTYRRKCSMKQQLIALALSTALLAGSAAAIAPEEAFPAVNTYPGFADVAGSAWYAATVQTCYEVGLMTGTGAGFAPDQVLTVGEVVAIAAA